ncbi:MAG: hypothetical protein K2Q26_04470 [Bdellovibrionales bacterium]|nr:hypothetical protein [Bdellovibrionales bacterium]
MRALYGILAIFFFTPAMAHATSCKPFRVHLEARAPAEAPHVPFLQSPSWEKDLVLKISRLEKKVSFESIYNKWLANHLNELTEEQRHQWLQCIYHYVQMDTDKDGIADWTAVVDQKPSRTIYPLDPDMDGDGIPNIFDSQPLDKTLGVAVKGQIPRHLISDESAVALWQKKLYDVYGIVAINHTAKHSPYVLKELYLLLEKSFSRQFVRSLKGIKSVYAFAKHDDVFDIAAYHHQMQAISIGGQDIYPAGISDSQKQHLLSTLAHEIGHAVLLQKIPPRELRTICEKNGWREVFSSDPTESFYDEAFFRRHPGWESKEKAHQNYFFTNYSYSNAHEWFADAFAKSILPSMAQKERPGSFERWLKSYLK